MTLCTTSVILAAGKVMKNMTNPFYYATVWRGMYAQVIGEIISLETYQKYLKEGQTLHSFTGRQATVCVISADPTINRSMKLDFATMFMKGTYVTISVDLKNLTSTTTKGTPPP